MQRTIFCVVSMLLLTILLGPVGCAPAPDTGWQWKQFQIPFDVMNFLNGTGPHQFPVKDARVTAVRKGRQYEFTVFYLPGQTEQPKGRWAWMMVTTPEQVYSHLNGSGPSQRPTAVEDARICAAWENDHAEYFIFYKTGPPGLSLASWEWRKLTAVGDVVDFLNGKSPGRGPSFAVSIARIAALEKNGTFEYHLFFKRGAGLGYVVTWKEQKVSPGPDDAVNYLNGREPYKQPVKNIEICAVSSGENAVYHIFPNQSG